MRATMGCSNLEQSSKYYYFTGSWIHKNWRHKRMDDENISLFRRDNKHYHLNTSLLNARPPFPGVSVSIVQVSLSEGATVTS